MRFQELHLIRQIRQQLLALGNKAISRVGKTTLAFLFLVTLVIPAYAQHNVTLNWDASSNCSTCLYNVWRSGSVSGPYSLINTSPVSGTSYNDTTVVSGQTYYYTVSSFFQGGTGATINVSSSGGAVTSAVLGLAGSGYTNDASPGTCNATGILYQQSQNYPGGSFPITGGGGTGARAFCTNGNASNQSCDDLQSCTLQSNGGSGYSGSFTENVPTGTIDSAGFCTAPLGTYCAMGFSNTVQVTVPSGSTTPNSPAITGVWK